MSSGTDQTKELQAICTLITWLDGYVHLFCVDPIKIERALKYCGDDIRTIWSRVRDDVYSIGKLPGSSKKVVRLSTVVNVTRLLFLILAVLAVVLWVLASRAELAVLSEPGTSLLVFAIFIIVFNSDIAVYIYSTRKLSITVKEYFESHADEAKPQRKRIREATQALIDKLASRIGTSGTAADEYQFLLRDQNYVNVRATRDREKYITAVKSKAR